MARHHSCQSESLSTKRLDCRWLNTSWESHFALAADLSLGVALAPAVWAHDQMLAYAFAEVGRVLEPKEAEADRLKHAVRIGWMST